MAQGGSNKKVANSLVAVSAAAVLAVYAAGYERTRSAAEQFDAQAAERRPIAPSAVIAPPRPAATADVAEVPAPAAPVSVPAAPVPAPARVASLERAPVTKHAPMPEGVPTAVSLRDDAAAAPVAPAPEVQPVAPAVTPAAPAASAPVVSASIAPATSASAATAASKWKDGTFSGWGTCRHGDIQAEVVIQGGRILSATIAQCLTRYSCNVIGRLPPEVVQRQSAEVDYVSGATESADAFYYAVFDALSKAK